MADEKEKKPKEPAAEKKPEAAVPVAAGPAPAGAPAVEGAEGAAAAAKKKKIRKIVPRAIVHIQSSFNNTVITVTDLNGDTLCWSSAGGIGYKGSRKSTPFAAQKAAEAVAEKAQKFGVREVEVKISGPGAGRESAIRALQNHGLMVRAIEDVTPLPHNGCRPRKRRRV